MQALDGLLNARQKADAKGKEIENEGTETNNFALQVKAINDIIETWRSSYNDLESNLRPEI